tara:strand:+ start:176 stop:466 length:291 start_codon:yes stop_codon:yes gene_type:complete
MKDNIKIKKPNRLDFYGVRDPKVAPAHFEYINVPLHYNLEKSIDKWILENLKGRYFVGKTIDIQETTRDMIEILRIGFEDPKELSYFTLACPYLKY